MILINLLQTKISGVIVEIKLKKSSFNIVFKVAVLRFNMIPGSFISNVLSGTSFEMYSGLVRNLIVYFGYTLIKPDIHLLQRNLMVNK